MTEKTSVIGRASRSQQRIQQRIVRDLQSSEGFVQHGGRECFAGFFLNLLVKKSFCVGQMTIDPVGEFDVRMNPALDQIRMLAQKFRAHDQMGSDEFSLRPEIALVEEQSRVAFPNEPRGPRFGGPGSIEFLLEK